VLEAFVASLGLEELTVFGQDWGGPIGLAVATRRPDRIRALILSNTFACRSPATRTSSGSRGCSVAGSAAS
jgi:pimeloyl-ACP methyl ester carboxylesterase